jgi:hypothetical protein
VTPRLKIANSPTNNHRQRDRRRAATRDRC